MKYPFFITSALTSFCLLASHSSLAVESTNVSEKELARWFEIEIILFKHLSKKSQHAEQFNSRDLSAKKSRAFDLLTPYLQPNISSLKQLLPNCQQPEIAPLYDISFAPYTLWPEHVDEVSANEDNIIESENNDTEANNDNKEVTSSTANMSVTVLTPEEIKQNEAVQQQKQVTTELSADPSLSEQDLSQPSYQVQYADIELAVYDQYPTNKQTGLCAIPAEFFQQNLTVKQLENFKIDGFPVDKLTNRVNGIEQWSADENGDITWASDQAYLISQNSLRLKSIANRIKRSRNYAPVLHLGWRQIGENRRKAKAMQLYAGDNLALDYKQAQTKQDAEQQAIEVEAILKQRQQIEELLNSQINSLVSNQQQVSTKATTENTGEMTMVIDQAESSDSLAGMTPAASAPAIAELPIAEQLRLQARQQQLDDIFQQFALLNTVESDQSTTSENTTNKLPYKEDEVKKIVAQLDADINVQERQLSLNSADDKQVVITPPLQPWSIDGLFKVHLDHYLYINTELNMVETAKKSSLLTNDKTKAELSPNENPVIVFKQDRRVITGEIHYFDHPHIGMVVQIRRFDPTKPADEAVSQSKK